MLQQWEWSKFCSTRDSHVSSLVSHFLSCWLASSSDLAPLRCHSDGSSSVLTVAYRH